jgi:glutamine cyclotransferase
MYYLLNVQRENFTHTMRDGWGLATDGKVLFGSDGTSKLYQLDPKSLEGYSSLCACCSVTLNTAVSI